MKENIAQDTPMVRQFYAVKAQYPEAVLLYRVGDFYETYGDDALLASKVLGLVLTKRSNGDKGTLPMAGFPHHAINNFLPKLVRSGYKVAICDQLEDPKLTKKLVKRGVTDLVTPGVAFNDEMLEQKEHNFLLGVTLGKNCIGAAFLDVSTGTFQLTEGSAEYISTLIASLKPKEIVTSRGCENKVRELFGDSIYVSTLDDWAFVHESAQQKLKKQLKCESLKGFGVEQYPLGVCSAGALLVYLDQTQHPELLNICSVSRIDEGKFVWMDRFTFRNLEIFSSATGSDGVSLVDVIDKCSSPMGARLLRNWLAMPVVDLEELERRYDIVSHFTTNRDSLEKIQDAIGNIGDLDRIISRAATGKIIPREIVQLGRGLSRIEPIRQLCSGSGVAPLESLARGIVSCEDLLQTIRTTLATEPAPSLGKGDVIAPGVDAQLDELRDIAHGGKDHLLQMQVRESERSGIPSLKISYNNVFGYYIEVRNAYKDKVPAEWVRRQTLVNAERYITEELKEYESKILGAQDKIYEIEARIYGELVRKIQSRISDIQTNSKIISRLDVLSGFASLAVAKNYCRPEMSSDKCLEIKAGRHPVIETLMKPGEEYVPNDIFMDDKTSQIMILTGPNMAGKSALLRQTALIVLMAQIGSFVPATKARIGWCDKIFTRVGASDNISRGESTFMVEMLETSMILHNLSDRSLILLDEIGRGTSTYDGMSIARAIVEFIARKGKGAKTLFATHYHELNDMENLFEGVKNFHIQVRESGKKVIFLRKLAEGGAEHSFGIHVARMAGMPEEVLESAERTLAKLESESPVSGHVCSKEEPPQEEGIQLSLFQLDDPTLSSIRDTLKKVDLNNMTPLQAFDLIRNMKKEVGID